jgi:S-(hydroxymethyl)mycothiol dehydrogenase
VTRGLVYAEAGVRPSVEEITLDPPGAGEVQVRVEACGVCHTDLHVVETGGWGMRFPILLGHEGAGIVEEVGESVTSVAPGDRVVIAWRAPCGDSCRSCKRGDPRRCSNNLRAKRRMHRAADGALLNAVLRCGTFADRVIVHEACAVKVPAELPAEQACLLACGFSTGAGATLWATPVHEGASVAVIGCGGVGLSALMAAVAVGAEPIVAVDAAPSKLDVARSFGASAGVLWAGSAEETAAAVREASGGGVDYAIEATGRPEAMQAAFLSTRARGAAVLIGIPREDAVLELPALSIPRMERRVLGSIYGSSRPERDFPLTLDLYRSGRLPLDRLVSHRLSLGEVGQGFELMKTGEALRVVIELGGAA